MRKRGLSGRRVHPNEIVHDLRTRDLLGGSGKRESDSLAQAIDQDLPQCTCQP